MYLDGRFLSVLAIMPGERYVPLGLLLSGLLGDVCPAGQFLSLVIWVELRPNGQLNRPLGVRVSCERAGQLWSGFGLYLSR
jgi:hypothetical protein